MFKTRIKSEKSQVLHDMVRAKKRVKKWKREGFFDSWYKNGNLNASQLWHKETIFYGKLNGK